MLVTETQIDELTRSFRIAVPAADLERKVEDKLAELARSARLPGFRPGKVPLALLRKRFGDSVKSEVVEEAINETTQSVIGERGLRAATPPKVEQAGFAEAGDLEYTFAIEVLPEVTPPDYSQITLERLVAEPDEAELQRRLERMADALGEETVVAEARPAAEGDVVVLDIHGPEDRWPFGAAQGIRLRIGADEGPLPGFLGQLMGRSPGERFDVTVTVGPEAERADLVGTTRTYDVEIKELRLRTPAPLDDSLAEKGGWENFEDIKTWIREQHEAELKSAARLRIKRALLDRLAELYTFPVPKGLVTREYEQLARQVSAEAGGGAGEAEHVHDEHCEHDHDDPAHGEPGHVHDEQGAHDDDHAASEPAADAGLTPAQRQEYQALAERRVRLGLVLAEVGRANNLQVTPEELAKAMIAEARRYRGQEAAVLEFLRKQPQAREALAAPILEEKVVDFMLEMAQVSERVVPVEDLLRDPDAETTSGGEASTESP
jgi:trigger factor